MSDRRFPPPWFIEEIGGYFVVKASNGRLPVFIYYWDGAVRRSPGQLLTRDAARLIAAGIAKLPGLVQWPSKETRWVLLLRSSARGFLELTGRRRAWPRIKAGEQHGKNSGQEYAVKSSRTAD